MRKYACAADTPRTPNTKLTIYHNQGLRWQAALKPVLSAGLERGVGAPLVQAPIRCRDRGPAVMKRVDVGEQPECLREAFWIVGVGTRDGIWVFEESPSDDVGGVFDPAVLPRYVCSGPRVDIRSDSHERSTAVLWQIVGIPCMGELVEEDERIIPADPELDRLLVSECGCRRSVAQAQISSREHDFELRKFQARLLESTNRRSGHLELRTILCFDLNRGSGSYRFGRKGGDGGGCQECCDQGGGCDANHVRTVSKTVRSIIGGTAQIWACPAPNSVVMALRVGQQSARGRRGYRLVAG